MSAFSGRQGTGASQKRRAAKQAAAINRNAETPIERTADFRRTRAKVQAAVAEARASRDIA